MSSVMGLLMDIRKRVESLVSQCEGLTYLIDLINPSTSYVGHFNKRNMKLFLNSKTGME